MRMRQRAEQAARRLARWGGALSFSLVFGGGLLSCLRCLGIGDWDFFTAQAMVAWRAVIEHGELPSWNPYHCGGMAIAENFQSRTYTPSFLLVLLFGPLLGPRVWVLVLLSLGFEGSRRLASELGAGRIGSLFAALAIAGNGHVALHLVVGHLGLLVVLLSPWIWLGLLRAARGDPRGLVGAAAWGGLSLVEGGLYPMAWSLSLAGLLSFWHALATRSVRAPAQLALAVGGALSLGAIVLLPAARYLARSGTHAGAGEAVPFQALGAMLLSLDQSPDARPRFAGQHYLWHEYGTYVGPVFFAALLLGAWHAPRRALWLLPTGLLLLAISLGDFGLLAPFHWLHELPVFASMRVPSRVLVFAVMCFALLGALGLDARPRLGGLTVALFALNLALVLAPLAHRSFRHSVDLSVSPGPFVQRADLGQRERMRRQHRTTSTLDVLHNRGNLACYDPIAPPVHARAQAPMVELLRPEGAPAGQARLAALTPSTLTVELAELQAPAVLLVNMNYHPGWQRSDGLPVRDSHGRIGTVVLPGTHRVRFVHRPLWTLLGALISALTALGMLLGLRRWRPARGRARDKIARWSGSG